MSISSYEPGSQGTIYHNAVLFTVDNQFSTASVIAVNGNAIVYVGNSISDASRLLPRGAVSVDLEGLTVIPGIVEGHMHFLTEGQKLSEPDLSRKPKEEILRIVAEEARGREPGQWITGRGWNNELWPETAWPGKHELDAAAPQNPVALTRVDGHSMWVNTLALREAGIDRSMPNPPGGEIVRSPDGDVQGILVDTPIFNVWSAIPAPTEEKARAFYAMAEKELFSLGVTSLVNASQTLRNHGFLKRAFEAGELHIRVYEMLAAHRGQDVIHIEEGGGPVAGLYDERLTMRAIKLIGDGSLGSRSAWLLADYADRPGHTGNGRYTDDEMLTILHRARDNGFQACVHAIGDACARQVVSVMDRALREKPVPDHRWRIEHFQTVASEDMDRAILLGIIPGMQTIHEVSDRTMALLRLGPERRAGSYDWRGVIDRGGIFANGSDAPMESVNPFPGMYAAIARSPKSARLTREEALRSFTIWSAHAMFSENRKGSLEPGKLADFAVLDRNIMTCPEEDIPNTQVLMTVVGGKTVFAR